MEILFLIVPLFIGIVFLVILVQIIRGVAEWARNNSMPVETVPARVVAKRTDTWRSGTHHHHHHHSHGRVRTSYFVTFELKSGERMEFGLYGKDYGLLVEGDEGKLTYQGTRYHRFGRRHLG
jgi:hypothetical protein